MMVKLLKHKANMEYGHWDRHTHTLTYLDINHGQSLFGSAVVSGHSVDRLRNVVQNQIQIHFIFLLKHRRENRAQACTQTCRRCRRIVKIYTPLLLMESTLSCISCRNKVHYYYYYYIYWTMYNKIFKTAKSLHFLTNIWQNLKFISYKCTHRCTCQLHIRSIVLEKVVFPCLPLPSLFL